MASDLVLVTGASGYVAGHCIQRLLAEGFPVRGTLRSLKRADEVRRWLTKTGRPVDPGAALSFVEAELTEPDAWKSAVAGVRYVLHVASPLPSTIPKNPDDLIVPALEGTLNVMRAAAAASVQRVVQTSSSAAIIYGRDDPNDHLFTEADWSDPDDKDNVPYTRSKTIAERAAWAELAKLPRALEWVAINPGLVLGPVLDRDASASGQRYIGSGPFASLSDIASILTARLGDRAAKVPTRKLPDWLVRFVGLFDAEVRGQVFELGKVRKLTSEKAEKTLGWSFRPLANTIVDTAESLEKVGALSSST